MAPPESNLDHTLREFAALSVEDRRAVERLLLHQERTLLRCLLKQEARKARKALAAARKAPRTRVVNCSPRLSKLLIRLAAKNNHAVTDATRDALQAVIARRRVLVDAST